MVSYEVKNAENAVRNFPRRKSFQRQDKTAIGNKK